MTSKRLITTVLACAAVAAGPASASAAEAPLTDGKCVSLEAMSGTSVREIHGVFSPATVVGDNVSLPPGVRGAPIACGTPEP